MDIIKANNDEKEMDIRAKLLGIQQELKAPKDQKNTFGNYKYRSAEQILEAVKPLLAKHECVLLLSDEVEVYGEGAAQRFYIKATAELRDADPNHFGPCSITAQAYAREPEAKKGMDESQITGTASSYARKYCLNGLFAIDDTKDADTNEHRIEQEARAEAAAKKPSKKKKSDKKPSDEATDEDRADLIAACKALNVAPETILQEAGWTGEKRMTVAEYKKAKELLEARS